MRTIVWHSEREKMLVGEPYLASDPELLELRRRARRLLRRFNDSDPDEPGLRQELLFKLLGALGPGSEIEPPFYCDYGSQIHAGKGLYLNFGCVILDPGQVTIGDQLFCGPGVHIYTASHPLDPDQRCQGRELALPVTIGDKVWIGGGSIICPGVDIGSGTTIGAGSVVTRSIPAGVLAAGNPCRIIRTL